MKEQIWSFETVVWYQEFFQDNGKFVLERFYKGVALEHLDECVAVTAGLDEPFKAPEIDDLGVVRFVLDGQETLFNILHNPQRQDLEQLFHEVGSQLARVQKAQLPGRNVPIAWMRLENYLGESYPEAIEDLRFVLGDSTIDRANELFQYISTLQPAGCLGGIGIGSIYVNEGVLSIPCGPEAGALPAGADVAWILGELTEIEHSFVRRGASGDRIALAGAALVEGYRSEGVELDSVVLTAMSALRTLLHYFDFSVTYPEQFPDEEHCRFVRWLIERASAAVQKEESHV